MMRRLLRLGPRVAGACAVALVAALAPSGRAAAQPQPTLVLSPSSGPCDATVEVSGTGFLPPSGPGETLRLYLVEPGTADVSMDILNPAFVQPDGTFEQSAPLYSRGCEAAALDSRAEHATGHLLIVASSSLEQSAAPPGQRISNIVAIAQYQYTTTAPPPQPIMALSPSTGPCDATVEITGRDFPASTAVRLDVAGGGGEATLGTLASLATDPSGRFALSVSLGTLGCEGAQYIEGLGAGPRQFWIFADREEPAIEPGGTGIPPILTRTAYTYTTTLSGAPRLLPATGMGVGERPGPPAWWPLLAVLGGGGLTLVLTSLYCARQRS
jgi:hypothetical protein